MRTFTSKSSPTAASPGDGAIVGGMAGVVGGLIAIVVGIPVVILTSAFVSGLLISFVESVDPAQAEMMRAQMLAGSTIVGAIISGLILAVLLVVFSVLGGLLGIPIFEKRKERWFHAAAAAKFWLTTAGAIAARADQLQSGLLVPIEI